MVVLLRYQAADHPAGGARRQHPGRHVPGDHAARADNTAVPDGHTRQDGTAAAEPDIVSYRDGTGKLNALSALLRVDGMSGGIKAAVGTDHHVVAKGDLCTV